MKLFRALKEIFEIEELRERILFTLGLILIFRLGASVKPIVNDFHTLLISADVLHPNNNSESINLGSEYALTIVGGNTFFLRGGVKGLSLIHI